MELLPEVLVFLRDGCDRLGYPAQLSSCETVTRPWTSWERRTIVMNSMGRVPACASGLRSGKSWLLSMRALLA